MFFDSFLVGKNEFENLSFFVAKYVGNKGVPGLESRTVGWLVSPAEGRQKKIWTPL